MHRHDEDPVSEAEAKEVLRLWALRQEERSGKPFTVRDLSEALDVPEQEAQELLRSVRKEHPPTLGRILSIVGTTMAGAAAVGALVGYLLGVFAPGYYRSVFSSDIENPALAGFGLGLTQGMIVGVFLGALFAGYEVWRSTRR